VGVQQLLGDAELEHQLTKITLGLQTLNLQQRKPYEFTELSELAQAFKRQQLKSDLVESLEQIGQQKLVVDAEIAQVRSSASSKTCELQLKIENLALAVSGWQSQVEIAQAISQVSGIVHQLEQRHTFDFGDLPQLLNGATNEQLLSQSGLDTKLALLAKQIAALTTKAPTRFEGMSALAENLQALQAQSQLTETDLTKKLNAIAFLVDNSNPQVVRYEEEANVALSELAQTLRCLNTGQQLLQGELLEQLQHTTGRAISAISQHIEQSKEDLSMLQTVERTTAFKQALSVTTANKKEAVTELTQQLRNFPLNEVAIRLGLTQDKYDKHKWRCEGQTISINDQKFYDHANLTGGYGAIDLVMHVQARDFKEALQWLADSSLELPPPVPHQSSPHPKVQEERQPFQPPAPDESKWLAVRQYLVEKRQLPVALVDELHSQGKIYADAKQNAVFLRQDIESNITGASLRGTYKDSSFKGLATGSKREGGWFSFAQGEGQLERIVLVESAIDALSAAALAEQPGKAMFVSSDGAGSVPTAWLRQQQQQGVEIVAAHDSDRAGEAMAWRLATELGLVTRATPTVGKDWNEQLKGIGSQPDVSQWKLVAQAIGKPDAYISRIEAVVASSQGLSTEAAAAMRQDFDTYKQTANDLWQWYQAARDISKPDAYLGRITEVAIAFHHPKSPTPLTQQAAATMQQDLAQHKQLLASKSWQHHSPITDLTRPMRTDSIVAYTDAKDSSSLQQERLNTRAVELSIKLLSTFAKNQHRSRVSWTGGWYTFTKIGSDVKINCSQRQATILEFTNGNLQGSITQRDVEKFEQVLEAIKEKEIGKQFEL
jgi:hypothetical protein